MGKKNSEEEVAPASVKPEVIDVPAKPVKAKKVSSKKSESREVAVRESRMPSPQALIEKAIENKVDVESLEKLVALQERWEAREAKKEYDRAMASFQSECPTIKKTKEVKTNTGQVAYRYAPIESIVEQVKDLLQKHGFSYSTSMELLENGVKVAVRVVHEGGHSEISEMSVPLGNKTQIMSASQQTAAAQTFAKRYAFCNAFGLLTGDEDNDGADLNTSSGNSRPAPAPQASTRRPAYSAPKPPEREIQMDASESQEVPRCQMGGEEITQQEAVYSIRMFGKPLCREHQKEARTNGNNQGK